MGSGGGGGIVSLDVASLAGTGNRRVDGSAVSLTMVVAADEPRGLTRNRVLMFACDVCSGAAGNRPRSGGGVGGRRAADRA